MGSQLHTHKCLKSRVSKVGTGHAYVLTDTRLAGVDREKRSNTFFDVDIADCRRPATPLLPEPPRNRVCVALLDDSNLLEHRARGTGRLGHLVITRKNKEPVGLCTRPTCWTSRKCSGRPFGVETASQSVSKSPWKNRSESTWKRALEETDSPRGVKALKLGHRSFGTCECAPLAVC